MYLLVVGYIFPTASVSLENNHQFTYQYEGEGHEALVHPQVQFCGLFLREVPYRWLAPRISDSQLRAVSPPQGTLAMCSNIFGCHNCSGC